MSGDEDFGNRMKWNGSFLVPNLREKQSFFILEYNINCKVFLDATLQFPAIL